MFPLLRRKVYAVRRHDGSLCYSSQSNRLKHQYLPDALMKRLVIILLPNSNKQSREQVIQHACNNRIKFCDSVLLLVSVWVASVSMHVMHLTVPNPYCLHYTSTYYDAKTSQFKQLDMRLAPNLATHYYYSTKNQKGCVEIDWNPDFALSSASQARQPLLTGSARAAGHLDSIWLAQPFAWGHFGAAPVLAPGVEVLWLWNDWGCSSASDDGTTAQATSCRSAACPTPTSKAFQKACLSFAQNSKFQW